MNKDKSSKIVWVIAAIVLVVGVGAALYALFSSSEDTGTTVTQTSDERADSPNEEKNEKNISVTIVFRDEGFTESPYEVAAGDEVRVQNASSQPVQFSSADHPTHFEEPKLNMETLQAGASGTFIAPSEPGEYGFHDHIRSEFTGTLIVK